MAKTKSRFGQKLGSARAVKESVSKSGRGPIAFIPKEGASLTVRFLDDPEEWVMYTEVYDPVLKKGYPLPEDETMPGYDDELRRSRRYLANAVDVERDQVIALQLPVSLVTALMARYEKFGTLTDRDYELYRQGSGIDTTYYADPDAPSKKRLTKYERVDLIDCLEEAYAQVFGSGSEDDEDDEDDGEPEVHRPRARSVTKKRAGRMRRTPRQEADDDEIDDDDDVDDDEDDEEVRRAVKKSRSARSSDDDEEEDDEDDDEVEILGEDALEDMSSEELRSYLIDFYGAYGTAAERRRAEKTDVDALSHDEWVESVLAAIGELF